MVRPPLTRMAPVCFSRQQSASRRLPGNTQKPGNPNQAINPVSHETRLPVARSYKVSGDKSKPQSQQRVGHSSRWKSAKASWSFSGAANGSIQRQQEMPLLPEVHGNQIFCLAQSNTPWARQNCGLVTGPCRWG